MSTTIPSAETLKAQVRSKYAEIARAGSAETNACCGTSSCGTVEFSDFSEDYANAEGYLAEADLGLGCGLPTEHAGIKPGDTVLDLGSGAGVDAFVARSLVGETGRVLGVDMTEAMIERARANAAKLGFTNVEFRLGEIEDLPVEEGTVDVAISNCVLNLVPDKERAFAEIYRVLRPGGSFTISDVVATGELPESIRQAAELYAGCVAGAMEQSAYLDVIRRAGFENVRVVKERVIDVPDEIYLSILSPEDLNAFRQSGTGLLSITVVGERPASR